MWTVIAVTDLNFDICNELDLHVGIVNKGLNELRVFDDGLYGFCSNSLWTTPLNILNELECVKVELKVSTPTILTKGSPISAVR